MRFSDAHCHVHLRTYNWLRHMGQQGNKKLYHPWVTILSNDRSRKMGKRASHYSQSDLAELRNGQVGLVFNVLYPLEKEFFGRGRGSSNGRSFMDFVGKFLNRKGSVLRDRVQGMIMDMPLGLMRYMGSSKYDYWQELKEELRFVLSKSGKKTSNLLFPKAWQRLSLRGHGKRRRQYPEYYQAEGVFRCPKTKEELQESLLNEQEITMVLTIEGAHSLGSDTASIDTLLERVDELRKWESPVLFITFAHHFDNKLCGHARSLPKMATYIYDQEPGMNGPINENGFRLIRKLLQLDEHNQRLQEGYRILIDVKHMAARSRKDYYRQIVEPCYQKGDIIPVIGSHCAYSGVESLNELIRQGEEESYEQDGRQLFNSWSINLCDEDILMIFMTRGIFGLSFDQRIMGLPDEEKRAERSGRNNIQAIWLNLKAVVSIIYRQKDIPQEEKVRIWDCICIGTDFDGYINPLKPYPTAVEFPHFARDLEAVLLEEQAKPGGFIEDQLDVKELLEKICYKNLELFALEHFPEKQEEEVFH